MMEDGHLYARLVRVAQVVMATFDVMNKKAAPLKRPKNLGSFQRRHTAHAVESLTVTASRWVSR